jgi:adenosylmethionine---8-amino-7-oxononanoate aminotransferase
MMLTKMYKLALHHPLNFFNAVFSRSMQKTLVERDRTVIWHPYTQAKLAADPLPIVRGEGAWLFDEAGNGYIDAISNWWVTIHGHAHPYLAGKVAEQARQLEQVIFAGFTHEPAVRLAERLLDILPGNLSKVFYSDNGSTAVEVAVKMAIQFWENKGERRRKILALSNSYHGDTFGSMSVSDRGTFTKAFEDYLFEVEFVDVGPVSTTLDSSDWVAALRLRSGSAACFIYEPLVQGAGGMKMYEAEKLNAMLKVCKENGVICIADEVMTGFGRTGKLFASEFIDAKPDIVCLSKGLTGGMMAMGATACTQEIYNAFLSDDRSKTFFHGHSYTANPIACAAANASLDLLLTNECMQNIERITDQHKKFAARLQGFSSVKNIRQCGTIIAFEVETNGAEGYLNNISSVIHQKALQRGVLLRPLGNTVYLMPPYCITEEELEKVNECVLKVI